MTRVKSFKVTCGIRFDLCDCQGQFGAFDYWAEFYFSELFVEHFGIGETHSRPEVDEPGVIVWNDYCVFLGHKMRKKREPFIMVPVHLKHCYFSSAAVNGLITEVFLDAQELVVFTDTVGTAH